MTKYAVPVILLLDADSFEEANDKASSTQDSINCSYKSHGVMALLDESLSTFAYDPEKHEVHSALDYDECAIRELSEPKKWLP